MDYTELKQQFDELKASAQYTRSVRKYGSGGMRHARKPRWWPDPNQPLDPRRSRRLEYADASAAPLEVCNDTGPLRWRLGNEMVTRRWNGLTLFNFMQGAHSVKDKSRHITEAEFVHAILSMGIFAATEAELRLLWSEARRGTLNPSEAMQCVE
jgi:hypothetical protein